MNILTDDQLIELLEQKTPDELTLEEIELLRSRLNESPALRDVLLTQLHMETYLTTALSRIELSPQAIVARAEQHRQGSFGTITLLALLLFLPLLALTGAIVIMNWKGDRSTDEVAAVADGKTKPDDDTDAGDPPVSIEPTETQSKGPTANSEWSKAKLPTAIAKAPAPAEAPVVKPSASPAALPAPWQAAVDFAGPPPDYHAVAFQPFDTQKSMPDQATLKQWFSPVPGHNHRMTLVDTTAGKCTAVEGISRLNSPWPENGVLRLALEHYNRLQIHFFSGEVGVTLVYYEDQNYRWAAYVTTRETGKPSPKTWAVTSTDDERTRRSELRYGGPIELRYRASDKQGGEVVLSRGDVVLVSAPLPAAPTEVFFEGRAAVQGISLERSSGGPALLPSPPTTFVIDRPADLLWKPTHPEITKPELLADGGVRLVANETMRSSGCLTPLPRQGLQEIMLELDGLTPGAGIFLSRGNDQIREVLRFFRNPKNGQLYAQLHFSDDTAELDLPQVHEQPVPIAAPHCWVKLLYGCGVLKWWISNDGIHWAQPAYPRETEADITGLGLEVVGKRKEVGITLRRIEFRELTGLTALAPAELREQAVAESKSPSIGFWLAETTRQQPADVDSGDWLRVCAVRTLAMGCGPELSNSLLEALLDDAAARQLPVEAQLAALNDASLLAFDLRDNGAMRVGLPRRYVELGLAAADRNGLPAWSSVRHAFSAVPIFTHLNAPTDLERPIRWEVVQTANGEPAQAALAWTRELKFFQQQRHSPLVEWLEAWARRDAPAQPGDASLTRLKDGWREPLVEELSKETYNALTELQAVLESEAWDDAARLVTSFDPEASPGVAPYVNDKGLLTSLPVAVRLTQADYPQLRESLGQRFAALAQLRIGQAMAAGDAATVELATIQFAGTAAAAEAHRWLGDRALASGWFARALVEYERAIVIQPLLAGEIGPRMRLAAAMQGRDVATPVSTSVQFGDLSLTAAEFEALVTEMKSRGQAAGLAVSTAIVQTQPVPPSTGYEVQLRSKLDGPVGDRPAEEVGRRTNQYRVPWVDRQIATVVEDDVMYVANRFQVAAYNLTNGLRTWQSQPPPGQIQRSQDWAMVAMQPLVTADKIFVRQLYSPNPLLVCLEKATGKLLWVTEPVEREYVVSDPVIVQGQLVALSASIQPDQQAILRWTTFDPATGELLKQHDLVRLRNTWGSRGCCEVTAVDDGLVAVLGGVTIAVDPSGHLRWVRKHIAMPAEEDPRWVLQMYQRPLVVGERIIVAQPGVRAVECLEIATGRRLWNCVLPEVLNIAGISGERLIVRTETDLRALDLAEGKVLWRCPLEEAHSFQLIDGERILAAQRALVPGQSAMWLTRLLWIDAATGQPRYTTSLPTLADADPRLGPIVAYKDRLFTFFGRGQHDPIRDVLELIPKGETERALPFDVVRNPWTQRIALPLTAAAFTRLAGDWQLMSGQAGDRTGLVDNVHGQNGVLGVRSTAAWPVALAREVIIPEHGQPRLRLRVGTDPGTNWKIEIRHGNDVVYAEEITDAKFPDHWKTIQVDLSKAKAKSGWLTIRAQAINGDHVLFVESAELVF